jgi:hypothetical protein
MIVSFSAHISDQPTLQARMLIASRWTNRYTINSTGPVSPTASSFNAGTMQVPNLTMETPCALTFLDLPMPPNKTNNYFPCCKQQRKQNKSKDVAARDRIWPTLVGSRLH